MAYASRLRAIGSSHFERETALFATFRAQTPWRPSDEAEIQKTFIFADTKLKDV
jgi:hypothetical protein